MSVSLRGAEDEWCVCKLGNGIFFLCIIALTNKLREARGAFYKMCERDNLARNSFTSLAVFAFSARESLDFCSLKDTIL